MAMTLRLDDQTNAALRNRAEAEGRSMQEVVRLAVAEYVDRHSRQDALDRVLDDRTAAIRRRAAAAGRVIYLDLEDVCSMWPIVSSAARSRSATPDSCESAAARPQTTVFGADAYSSLHDKAAALLQSVVGNHALVDGNKRLGLGSLIAFLGVNGWRLTLTNDEAYALVMAVASGELAGRRLRSRGDPGRGQRPGAGR